MHYHPSSKNITEDASSPGCISTLALALNFNSKVRMIILIKLFGFACHGKATAANWLLNNYFA